MKNQFTIITTIILFSISVILIGLLQFNMLHFPIPPYMRQWMYLAALLCAAVGIWFIFFKNGDRPPKPHVKNISSNEHVWRGVIQKYSTNSVGDVDGLLLKTEHGIIPIHFPPHTASKITQLAASSDSIIAKTNHGPKDHNHEMNSVSRPKTDKQIHIKDIFPAVKSGNSETISHTFKSYALVFDKKGDFTGIAEDSSVIALFRPHMLQSLKDELKGTNAVTVEGDIRPGNLGFVNKKYEQIIDAGAIIISGKKYLTR